MKCLTCRTDNTAIGVFCIYCGAPFDRPCPECGHRNIPSARYCAECGAGIGEAGAPRASQSSSPRPSDFFLTRAARDGERKLVTILFADIVDSTRLIEHLEPDEAAEQLNTVLACMREAVRRFDGTVNKMQGDGLMALFGAPIPQEDHAVRACCAALAMRESVSRLGLAKIRIGLHTGEAILQTISNDLSMQYDAMGIAVHIAARMEQAAGTLGIIVTREVLRAARGLLQVEPLGLRSLKGISQQLELFALLGIRSVVASQQFLGGQRPTSFVGRERELSQLNEALRGANDGSSVIFGIVGEPGAGKSRLAYELIASCRRAGISVLEARATAHGQGAPLRSIMEMTRSVFAISPNDSANIARSKIETKLDVLGLAADTRIFFELFGIELTAKPLADAEAKRRQLLGAFKRVLVAEGSHNPFVILFEDLHWLDESSEPFIDALIDSLGQTSILLLFSFRHGYRRGWMDRDSYRQMVLDPLSPAEVKELVDELLGSHPSVEPISAQIAIRAGGNPFFAEELVRAHIDQGAIIGARGNYERNSKVTAGLLPDTVRGVISFRVDKLDHQLKLFLESASVIGREFSADVAAGVAEMDTSLAQACIGKLLESEMLYECANGPYGNLAFKHPLVQEVAYASLVSERRRSSHRRVATLLTRHFASALSEHAATIAHHWELGGEPTQAAANYMMSATWVGTRDPVQALQTWKHVRELTAKISETLHGNYMRLMSNGQIINLSWRENASTTFLRPIYEEGMAIAKERQDVRAAALITVAYGRAIVATGSADDYLKHVEQAQAILLEKENRSVAALLLAVQSHAVGQAGFLPRALTLNQLALEHVSEIEPKDRQAVGFDPKHWLWTRRARYLLLTNGSSAADEQIEQLLNDCSENVDPLHRIIALGVIIEGALLDRDVRRAISAMDQLGALATGPDTSPYLSVLSKYFCGMALLVANRRSESSQQLRAALSVSRDSRAGLELEPLLLAYLAEATSGESMGAIQLALEARLMARRRSFRIAELVANAILIRLNAKIDRQAGEDPRSEFDRLVETTGATRIKLRIET